MQIVPAIGLLWENFDIVIVLFVLTTSDIAQIICIGVDLSIWQTQVLCKVDESCVVIENSDLCTEFNDSISTMFHIYSYSLTCLLSQLSLLIMFFVTHGAKMMPYTSKLHWRTLERGVAGLVFWAVSLLLQLLPVYTCFHRMLTFQLSSTYDELYRGDFDGVFTAIVFVYLSFTLISLACKIYALVTRAKALPRFMQYLREQLDQAAKRTRTSVAMPLERYDKKTSEIVDKIENDEQDNLLDM